jgi:hypothetical protein
MRIVEPWDDSPLFLVDPLRFIIGSTEKLFPAYGYYASTSYGNSRNLRMGAIEGSDFSIIQNQFRRVHNRLPPLWAITTTV